MSQTLAPRPSLRTPTSRARHLFARAFEYAGLAATLFGLVMLLVFFARLGIDVYHWFDAMPGLVRERNQKLTEQAAAAGDLKRSADRKVKEVDDEMEEALKEAPDAEKEKIRKLYDKVRARALADLEVTLRELANAEKDIRPATSPPALLVYFFTQGPSSEVEAVGIRPALLGSFYLVLITIVTAMPLGVGAAVYLEEYSRRNRLAQIIQININNLAAVPSVIYGILGAYIFVFLIFQRLDSETIAARNLLGGGLTLAMLILPVIIVSTQEALRAVPSSLRHAAHALGATHWQVVWHVVLPSSLPGMLTGMILSVSRALGEAAPLLLFGALVFTNQNPHLFSRFTALPLQIFKWTERPGDPSKYNAAMASTVLVVLLLALNGTAIYLRQRFQRNVKW
jgi:phosphate transport system permease protein